MEKNYSHFIIEIYILYINSYLVKFFTEFIIARADEITIDNNSERETNSIHILLLIHAIIDIYQRVRGLRKQFVFKSIRLRSLKYSLTSAIPFAPLRVAGSTSPALSGRHRELSRLVKTYLGCCIIDFFPRRVSGSNRGRVTQRICGRARLGSRCNVVNCINVDQITIEIISRRRLSLSIYLAPSFEILR